MNLPQQRRYALQFLRWYKRHERRAYRLVRAWLQAIKERLLALLERLGIQTTILAINDLVQSSQIMQLLTNIYKQTLPEAARREFGRLIALVSTRTTHLSVNVGFFSRQWQYTVNQMLIDSQTAQRITQIAETTRNQIRRVLVQANEDNVDVREAARRIRTVLGGKGARRRALLIARTETTRAAAAGHETGASSTSLKLEKKWIATADSRTRNDHRAMIGARPVPKDGYFLVGGIHMKYPGDPAGGADQCCNCRCVQAYIPVLKDSPY